MFNRNKKHNNIRRFDSNEYASISLNFLKIQKTLKILYSKFK